MASDNVRGSTEVNTGVPSIRTQQVPRLTAVSGPGQGRALAMTHAIGTAGRHPTNDLVLNDPRVSGVHLELRRVGDKIHVRDAGSTNGTWLGPHKVTEIELAPGGEIVIGDTLVRIDLDDGAAPAAVSPLESFGELVGKSTAMRELFATLERVAPKNLCLLIQGETGTGREEIARATHAKSTRAQKPFIVVDATSLPEPLAESILFGHEKGAVPGATDGRIGSLEAANGGTVFVDEIGELPQLLQSKFLRMLERQEITRVGGHAAVRVDVRVVAATNRDLRHEIDAGRFREDLFFRLAQVRAIVPPLRDRPEDIPVICQKLLSSMDRATPVMIEAAALAHLQAQPWPGNVRELKNVLARAAALAQGDIIRRGDVAGEGFGFRGTREERAAMDLSGTFSQAKERSIERFESAYLAALMKRCAGNLSLASREADLARHHLRDLLKKRGLYGVSWDKVE
jgi:DNA-binding NtrC family response regulator